MPSQVRESGLGVDGTAFQRNAVNLLRRDSVCRVQHSQMTSTSQPSLRRDLMCSLSRSAFPSRFRFQ